MAKKKRRVIDSLVLIFSIVIIAQLLTYVVPQGKFEREPYPKNPSHEMVVPGSYQAVNADSQVRLRLWHPLSAVPKGMDAAQEIIFLVFLVGGVIAILRVTGAIDAFLHTAVATFGRSPWILIAGCLVLFGMGSWTIGMGEEYVPLIPILIAMSLAMKMDAIVAMGMIWVPYGIGWACAGINPFGVLIAQDIAGLPPTSGWPFRLGIMVIFLAVGFQHVYSYALRVRRDPSTSLVADVDYSDGFEAPDDIRLTGGRILILLVFTAGIIAFVIGASTAGWYIGELVTMFLAVGLVGAIVGRLGPVKTSQTFIQGASEMTAAALIIGFARSIEVVLNDGQIIDTVINSIASLLDGTGPAVSAIGMLTVQSICNFFIPSGSGQAFVTMPIMSPLATLTHVPQQVAVLAYQFGDGFSNMFVPTSALVMGALALGRIPYGRWLKFVLPLMVKLLVVAVVVLIVALYMGESLGLIG
jgi:uncharacterized ion transporter superfamily protein YfcC